MEFTCEQIGMDQAELQERVVQGLVEKILGENRHNDTDEDGEYYPRGEVMKEVNALVEAAIKTSVEKIGEEHVYPMADRLITEHIFQKTTTWGEKKGEPLTFVEYLVKRAEEYLVEDVNEKGTSYRETQGHMHSQRDWKSAGPRLVMLVDQTLTKKMRESMNAAAEKINVTLAECLAETAKKELQRIARMLKVEVREK
jgi:hypothetical protein